MFRWHIWLCSWIEDHLWLQHPIGEPVAASGQSEAPLPHQEVESLKPSQVQRLQLDLRETDGTERSRGNGSHVTPRRNATRSQARAGRVGGAFFFPGPFFL